MSTDAEIRERYIEAEFLAVRREIQSVKDLQAALKELVASNRISDKEAIALALASAEKAVMRADVANEKRLDGLNELRQLAGDQASTYIRADVIMPKVEFLSERVGTLEGRLQGIVAVGALVSMVAAAFALLR